MEIDQIVFKLLSLHQNILLGLGYYKTFSKKLGAHSCFVTHKNIVCTQLFAMKIYLMFSMSTHTTLENFM